MLDPKNVPEQFRRWMPLAEKWGMGCDGSREELLERASADDLRELVAYREQEIAILTQWLAPETDRPGVRSREYHAFTALAMAADYAYSLQNPCSAPDGKQQATIQEILKWGEDSA